MKIVVTHHSPDLDAITSIWLVKRFLPGWEKARVQFVPAGERLGAAGPAPRSPIEIIDNDEVIHVDTGLGPLDHHQTAKTDISAASLTFKYVRKNIGKHKVDAVSRMVKVVVELDHFKECLWSDASADYHDFSLHGVMDGLGRMLREDPELQVSFMMKNLDSLLAYFENKVWAEKEIKKGIGFRVKGQRGIGFESLNDTVLPLAQKLGFAIVIRKDPRKGYARIKVRPDKNIDLTGLYKKLKELDPAASWFLHVSKKMLLNGTAKNPKMKPTKLSLEEIIETLKQI